MKYSKAQVLAIANKSSKNTLMETLEIEVVDYGEDFLVSRMPVTPRVHQPDGVLHGGATAALAESVGSFASHIFLDSENLMIRGLEITANHLKSISSGYVYAKATFLHKGRTTQLLDIRVTDEDDNLISLCKLSTISLPKKK
ncbi:PaaI family thioesterase [Olleya marilimosa]|uniref:Hotdog fold thioesterase n=1 Tax=Olleya marilimosa TaxID=272164 RepID=A0ABR8LRP1_9FLAO|nr:hotdog fold thioesterase [Olleya marilimosa]MBD3862141.1 hotdog fold thioesterase [Olleya marilimosa]MBD3889636.1 hotdog fold thioesterase [Olleya marilimosa]|tara:strand:- start:234625 stop:235050 length:426 start_codon:yes stop_codon:yes gene_type:complete